MPLVGMFLAPLVCIGLGILAFLEHVNKSDKLVMMILGVVFCVIGVLLLIFNFRKVNLLRTLINYASIFI